MNKSYEEILELLINYENALEQSDEGNIEKDFPELEDKLKAYFSDKSLEEKLMQAQIVQQALVRIIDKLESRKKEIKQLSMNQQFSWQKQKKYLETLQLQNKELWNS
ncbi:MAG: hypothetical protein K0R02_214 [Rickettsiaceae bacterium]|jgi:hypothetical protein|nr:hypothetical protein [Rickettsiaceae bacterium]